MVIARDFQQARDVETPFMNLFALVRDHSQAKEESSLQCGGLLFMQNISTGRRRTVEG